MDTDLKKKYEDKGARGLANIGSTCYLNTALQCLSHCLPFLDLVLHTSDTAARLMGSLKDLLQTLWIEQKGVAPHKFAQALASALGSAMNVKEENDIQEFMSAFLDKLNQCVGTRVSDEIIEKFSKCDESDPEVLFHTNARLSWLKDHKLAYSHLIDMFYGQQVNQLQCDSCHGIGHIFETFGSIMVSLSSNADEQQCLGELIEATLKKEQVESRECDFCKRRASGNAVQRFYRLPTVLMVNIKRFNSAMQKIRTPVTVPSAMDLSRVCLDTTQPHSYELVSIACHMGGLGSGHYFAVCKHPCGRWLLIDDDVVKAIEGPYNVSSECFYTLFYVKTVGLRPHTTQDPMS